MFQYADDSRNIAGALLQAFFARQADARRNRIEQQAEAERQFQHGRETLNDTVNLENHLLSNAPTVAKMGGTGTVLSEITGPGGKKTTVPGLTYESIRQAQEDEANKGTQVLTQDLWNNLPPVYQKLYTVGHRYKDTDLGGIGKMVFDEASKKTAEETKFGHEKTLKGIEAGNARANRVPTVAEFDGQKWQWDYNAGKWNPLGSAKAPADASAKKWYTETKTGNRVQLTQADLDAAAPGTYSDRPPTSTGTGGGLGAATAQRQKAARDTVAKLMGSEKDTEGDSLWAIVNRNTDPELPLVSGPMAIGSGILRSGIKAARLPGSSDLRVYDSQVKSFMPYFARTQGHTGNLTDREQRNAVAALPILSGPNADTKSEARRKMRRIENIMLGKDTANDIFDLPDAAGASSVEGDLMKDHGFGGGQ